MTMGYYNHWTPLKFGTKLIIIRRPTTIRYLHFQTISFIPVILMIISKKWDSEGHPDTTVNSSILDNILMLRGGHYWILIKNSLTETRSEEIYLLGPK